MESKKETEIKAQVREYLMQIALELEAASAGARKAAENMEQREAAMPHVQVLFSRLSQANYMLDRFKKTIDDALAEAKNP